MKNFEEIIGFLPQRLILLIVNLNKDTLLSLNEIRIRKNCPISIRQYGKTLFIDENSNLVYKSNRYLPLVGEEEMQEAFLRLCEYSVYSHLEDVRNGFVTLKNGCRVSFCATAVKDKDEIVSLKNINSFNIRVARQFIGCSDDTYEKIKKQGFGNVLIAGEPSCGKTTFLRDIARNLSNDNFNVSVIDERMELFGEDTDFQKGSCVDVFSSYPKKRAVSIAVRTMSPDFIITDEIGDEDECRAICEGINSGVDFVMSIHCRDYSQLERKEIFKRIENSRRFDHIVFLKGGKDVGKVSQIIDISDR